MNPFDVPSLPLSEPVFVFALALATFLIAPIVITRFGLPGIVGIVLVGAGIGPGGLGIVDHVDAIILLGEVGLIYLLFTVGLELDLRGFKRAPESAALFGLVSFGVPFIGGSVGAYYLLGLEPLAALLLASVFASHTLLAYPIINRIGVGKNDAVTAVFGGILFTDTIALVVLALVLGADEGEFGLELVISVIVSLIILFGLVWLTIPRIGRWFFRNLSEESYFEFLFVITAFFLAASLAELLDLAGILGAFVAGLALNRLITDGGTLQNRVEFAGNALFIPFFLLHVGMLVEFGVIFDGFETLAIATFIIGTMAVGKAAGAWTVGILKGYSRSERVVMFGLSTGQAAAALAITLLGYEAGLFSAAVLNAVVLMLLVTAIVSPWITERAATKLALSEDIGSGEGSAFDPRILLPLSHSADLQRRLLELSFVLKGGPAEEPVHVLTVVQPGDATTTEKRVEAARAELADLEDVAGAAEVPIQIESRVNHNVPSGISQAAIEERVNLLLMGWDADIPLRQRMFGSVIDNVLRQLSIPIMIARLGHPINTTKRLYILIPEGIVHHEGFFESLYLTKQLADRLGTDVILLPVGRQEADFERIFDLVEPELEVEIDRKVTLSDSLEHLRDSIDDEDLVAVITAKRGGVGWSPELNQLPRQLAELPPESFLLLYPREGEPSYDRQFLRFK